MTTKIIQQQVLFHKQIQKNGNCAPKSSYFSLQKLIKCSTRVVCSR